MVTFPTFRGHLNNPGISYLISENFEGTGVPTGWVYANSNGSGNFDSLSSGLNMEGNECLFMEYGKTGSDGWVTLVTTGFAEQSNIEVYFKLRIESTPSAVLGFCYLLSNSDTECLRVRMPTTKQLDLRCQTGTPSAISSGLASNTTFNTWIRWEQGTSGASNPYASIALSTGNSRPTSGPLFASLNVGVNTEKCTKIRFGLSNSLQVQYYLDKFRVTNGTSIPDDPL